MEKKFTRLIADPKRDVEDARARVDQQASLVREQILQDTKVWGPGESIKNHADSFEPLSGSIYLTEGDLTTDFFRNPSRLDSLGKTVKNRGLNYYISINPLRNNKKEKLAVIEQDIHDLKVALSMEGISWREKAALLDYAKQHALTLYHAIQYPVRFGVLLTSRHNAILKNSQETAIKVVSDFYSHLLGESVGTDSIALLESTLQEAKQISMQTEYFKMQELDHPMVILGNGYGNATTYKDTDLLVGLPSGGTQLAIVAKLFMNKLGSNPELGFVPVSTHSAKRTDGREMTDARLEKFVSEFDIKDKNVLIIEDNSNTGTTLSRMHNVVEKQNPKSLHVSVAELDPFRVQVKAHGEPITATDITHPDFSTAVNVVPITRSFLPDRQLRKFAAQKIVYRGLEVSESATRPSLSVDDYESLHVSADFLKFEETYKDILRSVGDKYGYRNPYMIALELYKRLAPSHYKNNLNTPKEREVMSAIATAAVSYPHIPEILKEKLGQATEVSDYETGRMDPWMISGARNIIDACFNVVSKHGGKVYVWTKGDSHRIGYSRLPGTGEQMKRFNISGLSKCFEESLAFSGLTEKHFKFMALPDKARVINEIVCVDAKAAQGSVFIIDDMLDNIKTALAATRNSGVNTEVFLMDDQHHAQSLADAASLIKEINKPFFFVLDMDDTLLHEKFRKEHQPMNIYLEMQRLGLLKETT